MTTVPKRPASTPNEARASACVRCGPGHPPGIDLALHGETAYDLHTLTAGRAGGHGILRPHPHPEPDEY